MRNIIQVQMHARQAMEAGMNAHIAKPIDVEKLLEILASILKEHADSN